MERIEIVFHSQKLGMNLNYTHKWRAVRVDKFVKQNARLLDATLIKVNGDDVGTIANQGAFESLARRVATAPRPLTLTFEQKRVVFAAGD